MNFIKNKLKELLFISIIFLITMLIYTILIYFQILKLENSTLRTTIYITGLVLFLIFGIISGIIEKKNGWLSGITSATLIIILTFIINLISKNKIDIYYLVKIITFLLSSTLGGMIGVNLTKNN